MSVIYVPRSAWTAWLPTSNSGNPRPRLRTPVPMITRHYTGSPPSVKASTWAAKEWMPWFQSVALASGKSFEYNYVVPPRVDGSAQVWEYAGEYQAAHSAGENDVAIGVLFAVGVANHPSYANFDPAKPTVWEPCTDAMVDAYRWLRDVHLKDRGVVLSPAEVEHRHMPAAATACPGNSVTARAADLSAPFVPTPPPPEEPVVSYFKTAPDSLTIWATSDGLVAVRLEEFHCQARGINPATVQAISSTDAAKFVYQAGFVSLSVK